MQLQHHKHFENIDSGPLPENMPAEELQPAQNIEKKTLKKRVKLDFTREGLTELIKQVHADNPDNFTTTSFQRRNVKPQDKQPWEKNAKTFYTHIKRNLPKLQPIFQVIQTEWDEDGIEFEPGLFAIKANISHKDLFAKTIAILCPEEAKDFNKDNLVFTRDSLTNLIKQVHADNPASFTTGSFERKKVTDKQPWEKNAKTFYTNIKTYLPKLQPIFQAIQTEWDEDGIEYEPGLFAIKANISKKDLFAKTIAILCPEEAKDFHCKYEYLDFTRSDLTKLIKQVHADNPDKFTTASFQRQNIKPADKQPWEKNANTFYSTIKPNLPKLQPIFQAIQTEWDEDGIEYEPGLFAIKANISRKDLFAKTIAILCPEEAKDFHKPVITYNLNYSRENLTKLIKQVHADNPANFTTESFQRRNIKPADKQPWEKNAKTFYLNIKPNLPKLQPIFQAIQTEWDETGIDYEPGLFAIDANISHKDLFAKTIAILCPLEAKDYNKDKLDFTKEGLTKLIKQVHADDPDNFTTTSFLREEVTNKQPWEKNANTFYSRIKLNLPKLRPIFATIQTEWDEKKIKYEPGLFAIDANISKKDLFDKTIRILAPETYPSFKYNALVAPARGFILQHAFESALKIIGHNLGEQLKIEPKVGSKKPDLVYYNPDKQIEIMFDVKLQTHTASASGDTINYPKLLAKHGNPNIKKHLVFLCLNGQRGKTEYDHKKNVKISYINVLKLLKDALGTEVSQPKQYPYKFLNTSPDLTTDQKLTLSRIYKFLNHLKTMVSENKHHVDLSDGDFKKLQTAHNKMRNRLRKLARKGTRQDIMDSDIWEKFDDLN